MSEKEGTPEKRGAASKTATATLGRCLEGKNAQGFSKRSQGKTNSFPEIVRTSPNLWSKQVQQLGSKSNQEKPFGKPNRCRKVEAWMLLSYLQLTQLLHATSIAPRPKMAFDTRDLEQPPEKPSGQNPHRSTLDQPPSAPPNSLGGLRSAFRFSLLRLAFRVPRAAPGPGCGSNFGF